jgi:hypothetical protein
VQARFGRLHFVNLKRKERKGSLLRKEGRSIEKDPFLISGDFFNAKINLLLMVEGRASEVWQTSLCKF